MPGIEVGESLKNVPFEKRLIVRTNLLELILQITLFLSGTFFLENPITSIPGVNVAHFLPFFSL